MIEYTILHGDESVLEGMKIVQVVLSGGELLLRLDGPDDKTFVYGVQCDTDYDGDSYLSNFEVISKWDENSLGLISDDELKAFEEALELENNIDTLKGLKRQKEWIESRIKELEANGRT